MPDVADGENRASRFWVTVLGEAGRIDELQVVVNPIALVGSRGLANGAGVLRTTLASG